MIAKQREVIYVDRRAVLERADMHERVLSMIRNEVTRIINEHIPSNMVEDEETLVNTLHRARNRMLSRTRNMQ